MIKIAGVKSGDKINFKEFVDFFYKVDWPGLVGPFIVLKKIKQLVLEPVAGYWKRLNAKCWPLYTARDMSQDVADALLGTNKKESLRRDSGLKNYSWR